MSLENMIDFLCLFLEIMLRPKSIARASVVKIELSIGRAFLRIDLLKTSCVCCFIVVLGAIRKDI